MAVFDGLVNWWGWGDCAESLFDTPHGTGSFPFVDHIAAFGLPAHDGVYSGGSVMYNVSNDFQGTAEAVDPAPWSCRADESAIEQTIPGSFDGTHGHDIDIDPQVGHFGNNLGTVTIPGGSGLWFDPSDGWTLAFWLKNTGGYYIGRAGAIARQYLMSNDFISDSVPHRGWNIVADFDMLPITPAVFDPTTQTTYAQLFDPTGVCHYNFVMDGLDDFSLSLGLANLEWKLAVITYDGTTFRSYRTDLIDGVLDSVDARYTEGGVAYSFGARYNLGSGDDAYTAPWNGAWDEVLQWNRPLSLQEIKDLPSACDAHFKLKGRYYARSAEGNNRFTRARRIRGSSGQTVPIDVAGNSIELLEPKGKNLKRGLHQTAWYKWTAPASGSFTFHTGNGSASDLYSAAPLEVTPNDATDPDGSSSVRITSAFLTPAISGSYRSPPPSGSVFPHYPRSVGHSLMMFPANGDEWVERNPDPRLPGAARTIIDWPSGAWTQIAFPYTTRVGSTPSYGSDQRTIAYGRNAYIADVPQEDPEYLGPDHTDDTGPAATYPHWFTDVVPATGHVWDTGWVDPDYFDANYPHMTSDGGLSFDTLEAGIYYFDFVVTFSLTNRMGDTVEDLNHPYANRIGIDFVHWKDKTFKVRMRETVTDTVVSYYDSSGIAVQLNGGEFFADNAGGYTPGVSPHNFTLLSGALVRIPAGRNFVVEVWQNTGTTLHTDVDGLAYLGKLPDDPGPYPYPQLP